MYLPRERGMPCVSDTSMCISDIRHVKCALASQSSIDTFTNNYYNGKNHFVWSV